MIRKKIVLLAIFNVSLFFYFYSLHQIKLTQEGRRELRKKQTVEKIEFPSHLSQVKLSEWGGDHSAKMINDFSQWLKLKNTDTQVMSSHAYLQIKEILKKLENNFIDRSFSEVSKSYIDSSENLKELVSSRHWKTLEGQAQQLPQNISQIDYKFASNILEQILEITLSSTLSQSNKELVLYLASEIEKELLEHRILQEQYEGWNNALIEAKKLSRIQGQFGHVSSLEVSPYESFHLFLAGILLFLIMNSWIIHSNLNVQKRNVFSVSLKDAGVEILKMVSTLYKGKNIPYRVVEIKDGRTLLSTQLKKEMANDLFCIQQNLDAPGKIVFDEIQETPILKLAFLSPVLAAQKGGELTPIILRTHKSLQKLGGEVSLEAEFDEEGEVKTLEVLYRLPQANQLAVSV